MTIFCLFSKFYWIDFLLQITILQKLFVSFDYWYEQYTYIFCFMFVSLSLCLLLFGVAFTITPNESNFEKASPYECGFEPFGLTHSIFNIQFFIVGILFMIFDLELAYLFPWVLNLGNLSFFSCNLMFFFLILLTIGFIYEWKKKALEWV